MCFLVNAVRFTEKAGLFGLVAGHEPKVVDRHACRTLNGSISWSYIKRMSPSCTPIPWRGRTQRAASGDWAARQIRAWAQVAHVA